VIKCAVCEAKVAYSLTVVLKENFHFAWIKKINETKTTSERALFQFGKVSYFCVVFFI